MKTKKTNNKLSTTLLAVATVMISSSVSAAPPIYDNFKGGTLNANRKDHLGKNYFERPDGRVVPECGYQVDDWLDDYSNNDTVTFTRTFNDPLADEYSDRPGASAESGGVESTGVSDVSGCYG